MTASGWAVVGAMLLMAGILAPAVARAVPWEETPPIRLAPRDPVARRVAAAPEGATFVFAPGVYRGVTIAPRAGQRFIGETRRGERAILNGAVLLESWRASGSTWSAGFDRRSYSMIGECEPDRPFCLERESLFVDGRRLRRVAEIGDLGPGTWVREGRFAVIGFDPEGRTLELSGTEFAFLPSADDVTIENLTVEKYIPGAQEGAIKGRGARGWRVIDTVARHNHGAGLDLGDRMTVRGGAYIRNGQMGLRAEFGQALIEDVEIAHNNTAGYLWGWEAGGTKFLEMTGLVVRRACVHHNDGPGLWTDANNANVTYEDNLVFRNSGDGIKHEISYNAVIRNNVSVYNGFGFHRWFWGAQILVQNSSETLVTGNRVDTLTEGGNAITVVQQDRTGGGARWMSADNTVTDNVMVLRGRARAGLGADFDRAWFYRAGGNVFDANTYHVAPGLRRFFGLRGDFRPMAYVRRHGMEVDGTVSQGALPRMREPVCDDLYGE